MTTRREVLALIPARGGSKSIPRKNLLMLAGKPLIAYSIEQALASRQVTRTIVSTDDPEIAEVARACGAEVPFMRPPEFAEDLSPDVDVFRHALTTLRDSEAYSCECVVHLRPTGPVRQVARIDEAIEMFLRTADADSLRSVTSPAQSPYKMWRVADGLLEPLVRVEGQAEAHSLPRQMLPDVFWQNGYVDIVRPRVVLDLGMMAGHRILPFIVHEPVLELDYPENIPLIEAALRRLQAGTWRDAPSGMRHPV
ncbi:MAG: acylneuraminate cytidylyltransferase family protein [Vicinamibacterales bacterium]